jgi:hypothetical protein
MNVSFVTSFWLVLSLPATVVWAFQVSIPSSTRCCSSGSSNGNRHLGLHGLKRRQSTPFDTTNTGAIWMASSKEDVTDVDASMEEEIERIFQEEKEKTMRMSRFSNEKGMEYAPWMNMTPDDEARIRTLAREKTIARRKRQTQEQNVRGSLLRDSTNQELSGTGLQYKIIDGDSIELEWATDSEPDTKGYLVKRRAAKTTEFMTIASYETFAPLNSKGVNGGTYRYLDENVGTGTSYVYRITEKEGNGEENDLSQCLVEIQSATEKRTELIAIAGISIAALAVVAAGLFLDPVQ